MATQQGAISGISGKRKGFYQTEAMNAQLPYLSQIMATAQQKRQREEDVAFREKQYSFDVGKQAQEMKLAKQQMQEQRDAQQAQMGLEAGKLGFSLATNPNVTNKSVGSMFGGAGTIGKAIEGGPDWLKNLNLGTTIGPGLAGFGLGAMAKKKGTKVGLGALGGALTGLVGAGAGAGLSGAISGGVSGGLGGLLSGLL